MPTAIAAHIAAPATLLLLILSAPTPSHAQNCHMEHYATGNGGTVDNLVCGPSGGGGRTGGGAAPVERWAAVAVSGDNRHWGASWGRRSRADAEGGAIANCGSAGASGACKIRYWSSDYCVALAMTVAPDNTAWAVEGHARRDGAQANAMRQCLSAGGVSCKVEVAACPRDR